MKTKAPPPDAADDDPLDDYIPVAEAARRLRVGEDTIRRLGHAEKVKMVKVVGRLRVSKKSLDAFIRRELEGRKQGRPEQTA